MAPLNRFVIWIIVTGLLCALLLCNMGALAGGHIVLSVVDPGRLALAYWLCGGGFLLTSFAAMVFQRRRMFGPTSANGRQGLILRTWLGRAAVTYCVLLAVWSVVGILFIRGGVRFFNVTGSPQLIQAKVDEQAFRQQRSFLLLERPGDAAMLVVRRSLADGTVAELTAAGLSVREDR